MFGSKSFFGVCLCTPRRRRDRIKSVADDLSTRHLANSDVKKVGVKWQRLVVPQLKEQTKHVTNFWY